MFVEDGENILNEQSGTMIRNKKRRSTVDHFAALPLVLTNLPRKSTVTLLARSIDSAQIARRGQRRFFTYWEKHHELKFKIRYLLNGELSEEFSPADLLSGGVPIVRIVDGGHKVVDVNIREGPKATSAARVVLRDPRLPNHLTHTD